MGFLNGSPGAGGGAFREDDGTVSMLCSAACDGAAVGRSGESESGFSACLPACLAASCLPPSLSSSYGWRLRGSPTCLLPPLVCGAGGLGGWREREGGRELL